MFKKFLAWAYLPVQIAVGFALSAELAKVINNLVAAVLALFK